VKARAAKPEASATAVFEKTQVHLLLKGLLDFEEERKRLRKEIQKHQKEMETMGKKLSNEQFVQKAAPEIVEEVRSRMQGVSVKVEKLNRNLTFFESIHD